MPGRRVIVHAGFHKTGTTTAQKFLRANGKNIYPRCALILPGRLRKGPSRLAMQYSRFGTPALLDEFGDSLHAVLSEIDVKDRSVLICDENLAGRMPGRDGQPDYGATPALMARAEDVICDIFGAEADVVFHFSTRQPAKWLHSTYKHNLRTLRLNMDADEYAHTFGPAADLDGVTVTVAKAVTGTVYSMDVADMTEPEGPARPLIDLMGLPPYRRSRLAAHPNVNIGPDDALIDELLALNRSNLSDDAVIAAKADLLQKDNTHDG